MYENRNDRSQENSIQRGWREIVVEKLAEKNGSPGT